MHTKDVLAAALRGAGLHEMADRAAEGYYHDYLSPLDLPALQLLADLEVAATPAALALRARHLRGEFDASEEEGAVWAASSEAQAVFSELTRREGKP
ncbi:MAG TPA: hypothetical protein VNO55_19885 [Polyangia bacterium]|nr:hypothetical protein [Polyangia bacterium]